jgi:Pectate lyase superfamily protein/Chaperone of endosialidase
MLRREFPRILLASAAGVMTPPSGAQAQQGDAAPYERTLAEKSAGVAPADRTQPPLNVLRYAANSEPGVTDMTDAFRAALSVAAVNGGTVYAPAQTYRITAPLTVPSGVTLCGDGLGATTLEHHIDSAGAVAVTLGSSDTGTSYGCGLRNLCIRMHVPHTTAMMLRATIGAWVENVQLLGDARTFSYTGCVIRGGSKVGCFFNVLQNVYAEHFHVGFLFTDLGVMATNQIFVNCSVVGDYAYGDRSSVGVLFAPPATPNTGVSGESSLWLGGDLESCATGVSMSARTEYTQWFGTRFEGNGLDVDFGTNTSGTARNTFFGPANSFHFEGSLRPDNGYYLGPDCSGVHISRGAGGLGSNIAIGNSTVTLGEVSSGENTAVGAGAGRNISGARNTAIGCNAQCGAVGDGNIAIGCDAGTANSPHTLAGSHQAVFGDSALTNAYIQVPWTTSADRRDGRDATPLGGCLDVVCALRPVSFRMSNRSRHGSDAGANAPGRTQTLAGLIAQDVESALRGHGLDPGLVVDASDPDKLGLTYERLIPFLAGAITELTSQVRSLRGEVEKLRRP